MFLYLHTTQSTQIYINLYIHQMAACQSNGYLQKIHAGTILSTSITCHRKNGDMFTTQDDRRRMKNYLQN